MRPKWMDGEGKPRKIVRPPGVDDVRKLVRRAVDDQESRVLLAMAGKRTPASGALEGAKGDGNARVFKIECKLSVKKQLKLKKEWFEKITREAEVMTQKPVLAIELEQPSSCEKDWVCLRLSDFQWLLRQAGV